jgi:hypothetical protein
MREEQVRIALQALKEHDQSREAPRELEARLLEAVRERRRRAWARRLLVAAAAILAIAFGLRTSSAPVGKAAVERAPKTLSGPATVAAVERPAPQAAAPRRASRPVIAPRRELVTDFYPLMDPAPPLGRGQLLRVVVPARAMRTVGLPVREESLEERVQADVLVGEEGLARAIRFVRPE